MLCKWYIYKQIKLHSVTTSCQTAESINTRLTSVLRWHQLPEDPSACITSIFNENDKHIREHAIRDRYPTFHNREPALVLWIDCKIQDLLTATSIQHYCYLTILSSGNLFFIYLILFFLKFLPILSCAVSVISANSWKGTDRDW